MPFAAQIVSFFWSANKTDFFPDSLQISTAKDLKRKRDMRRECWYRISTFYSHTMNYGIYDEPARRLVEKRADAHLISISLYLRVSPRLPFWTRTHTEAGQIWSNRVRCESLTHTDSLWSVCVLDACRSVSLQFCCRKENIWLKLDLNNT